MKRSVFFISIILLFVIVCSIFIINNKAKNKDYQLEIVYEINYMLAKENNKFGVIDKAGNKVIDTLYDEIQIPNPSKPVFICKYNYDSEKNEYSIKVLYEKSEQILFQYLYIDAIKINIEENTISPYEKSVLKYKEKNKYGLINFNGDKITKPIYDEISGLDYQEGLLKVKKDNKYGIININGVSIIKEKYDDIVSDKCFSKEKTGFIVNKNNKYGFISYNGKEILETKYNQISRIKYANDNNDIYLIAFENEKAGLYKNKNCILQHQFEDISYDINTNCVIVQKDNMQGVFDLQGNKKLNIEYINIYTSGKYINAIKEDMVDIYNSETEKIENYDNIIGLHEINNEFSIGVTNEEKYKILNCNTNEFSSVEYDYLEYVYDNNCIALKNGKYRIN